jgi:hypothetical protein
VLIVATFRSYELHRGHPLRPMLAELNQLSRVVRLHLPRLTRHEGHEFVAGLLGREPDQELRFGAPTRPSTAVGCSVSRTILT